MLERRNPCRSHRCLNRTVHTVLIDVGVVDIELVSEELASWGFKIGVAGFPVDEFHSVGNGLVIDHIVDLRLVKGVVLEAHDSVAHHDALDVDVLEGGVCVVVKDEAGDVRHVFSGVALA